jgi:hypothetical protein
MEEEFAVTVRRTNDSVASIHPATSNEKDVLQTRENEQFYQFRRNSIAMLRQVTTPLYVLHNQKERVWANLIASINLSIMHL